MSIIYQHPSERRFSNDEKSVHKIWCYVLRNCFHHIYLFAVNGKAGKIRRQN